MPFPRSEIELSYRASPTIAEGYFREDREVTQIGNLAQNQYMAITKDMNADMVTNLDCLLELMREMQEYQCRHSFTEGWLAAMKYIEL